MKEIIDTNSNRNEKQIELIENAKEALEFLRKQASTTILWQFNEIIKEANCSLKDVGTNEGELEQLTVRSYKNEAKKLLEIFRDSQTLPEESIEHIRDCLEKAECTLQDIGSSEQELEQLAKEGYMNDARKELDILRNSTFKGSMILIKPIESDPSSKKVLVDLRFYIESIYKSVKKAKCTLEDIGTSEEELQKFLNQHQKT